MTETTDIRIRKILFASDFSPHANRAFDAALALAKHFGAQLHLLHVVHHPDDEAAAQTRLESFARERGVGVEQVVTVATGHAAAQIVAYAERERAALIVMGTHGRTGLAHLVRGSVAEAVMRRAPCLVVTIRRKAELPLVVESPPTESPAAHPHGARPGHCLVCAGPSPELVCEKCTASIRAEAFHRLEREERAGR
jgi:nucleotide-binding universal stress UspA family protein